MVKPYGKTPRRTGKTKTPRETGGTAFKIRLRGKDGAPLSMTELQQGLYDISRKLQPFGAYRAKWVTLYLTAVDEDGEEVLLDPSGEWTIYPYKSAADEAGL